MVNGGKRLSRIVNGAKALNAVEALIDDVASALGEGRVTLASKFYSKKIGGSFSSP